jgi:hypothetical protein
MSNGINRTGGSAVRSPTDSALNDDTKLASLTANILVFRRQNGHTQIQISYLSSWKNLRNNFRKILSANSGPRRRSTATHALLMTTDPDLLTQSDSIVRRNFADATPSLTVSRIVATGVERGSFGKKIRRE